MKLHTQPDKLKYLALGMGVLGLELRLLLYATGTDEKGLLVEGHWAHFAIWGLTVAAALCIWLLTRSLPGSADQTQDYPASLSAALSALALGAGIFATTLTDLTQAGTAQATLLTVLGFAAGLSQVAVSFCRALGRKPWFLLPVILCVYFVLRMVSLYQIWSSDPQLQDYFFYLLAYVALMLTAYHQAAFCVGMGNRRKLCRVSLGAVYLCCLSLSGSRDVWLLLASAVWAFFGMDQPAPEEDRL